MTPTTLCSCVNSSNASLTKFYLGTFFHAKQITLSDVFSKDMEGLVHMHVLPSTPKKNKVVRSSRAQFMHFKVVFVAQSDKLGFTYFTTHLAG